MTVLPVRLVARAIFSGGLGRWVKTLAMAQVPAFLAWVGMRTSFSSDLNHATDPAISCHDQSPTDRPRRIPASNG